MEGQEPVPPLAILNYSDDNVNRILHLALLGNDQLAVDILAKENINLNIINIQGYTPLNLSIMEECSELFVMSIIKAGCDINIVDKFKVTPLHNAVAGEMKNIAHELIKQGADINTRDMCGSTPLHYAAENNNVEALCMLLYYGADTNILDIVMHTPLTRALFEDVADTADILFNYYDNFDDRNEDGETALHLATLCDKQLTIKMIEAGADVNCITCKGSSVLELSLFHNDCQVFKMIWTRLDLESLLNCAVPILCALVKSRGHFPSQEWVECMYLVLTCPVALELMEHVYEEMETNFLRDLIYGFSFLGIEIKDRMTIIHICLSLGAHVELQDLDCAIKYFGFNEELETLIYMTDTKDMLDRFVGIHPLLPLILALEDCRTERAFESLKRNIECPADYLFIVDLLGFFSIPYFMKKELEDRLHQCFRVDECIIHAAKLEATPEVPSLLELSRNKVFNVIRENSKIKRSYHFHEAVMKLNVPRSIQDIIRFKKPVYDLLV